MAVSSLSQTPNLPDAQPLDTPALEMTAVLNQDLLKTFQEGFHSHGLTFEEKLFCDLPQQQAFDLVDTLYGPDERFAQVFYNYRIKLLGHSHEEATQSTQAELAHHIAAIKSTYKTDRHVFAVGYRPEAQETDALPPEYRPVGLYCMRPVLEHERGQDLLDALSDLNMDTQYAGKKALVHSFCLLKDFRNLHMLKYIFINIGLKAVRDEYAHLFFFFSDHRLKGIYERYGLTFPADLKFRNSQHAIGCFSMTEANMARIHHAIEQLAQDETPA